MVLTSLQLSTVSNDHKNGSRFHNKLQGGQGLWPTFGEGVTAPVVPKSCNQTTQVLDVVFQEYVGLVLPGKGNNHIIDKRNKAMYKICKINNDIKYINTPLTYV